MEVLSEIKLTEPDELRAISPVAENVLKDY